MEIGDKVICVRGLTDNGHVACVKGEEYIVLDIMTSSCGHEVSLDIGTTMDAAEFYLFCDKCGSRFPGDGIWWLDIDRFRKIEYRSAHSELVKEALIKEKSDVPIKEVEPVEPV